MTLNRTQRTLGDLVTFKTGKLNSNAAVSDGAYPFFTCSQETYRTNTYSFDTECVLLAGNNANGIYPIKYFSGKFDAYQRTYIIRPKNLEELETRFLFYALQLKLEMLKSISTGAATKFLTLGLLQNVDFELPPLETQQQIAAILSAYDDLIENNARRIKVLEEMAGLIYREWFVNFRFTGHEGVKMVDSELGEIPEGWEISFIEDLASMEHKSVQPDKNPDEVFEYYSFPAFDGGRSPDFTRGDEIKSNKYLVPQNVILFPKLNLRFPRVWLPYLRGENRSIASTEYVILQPRGDIKREYLFAMLTQPALLEQAVGTAGGTSTSHQRISPKNFVKTPVIIPTEQVRQDFEAFAVPTYDQIQNLRVKNQNLRQTRALLLPKLISGELDVSQLGEAPLETAQVA